MTRTNQFRADFIVCQTLVVLPFTVHFPDVGVAAEQQAYAHAHHPQHGKQKRRAASLPGPEQPRQQTVPALGRHHRLKYGVHQQPAQKISQRDGEELKGVPGGKDPPLNFRRNAQAVDGVH